MPPLCTPEKNKSKKERNVNERKIERLCRDLPELSEHFDVHSQVGEGTFSSVYVATLKTDPSKKFAMKHMVRTCHPDRVRIELECLKKIGGSANVVGVDFCLREGDNIVFVMPYLKHQHFNTYVGKMDAKETAFYMKNLLLAVERVHEFNVIHRDVKPSNFLYDRETRRFLLVDFGLAQELPGKVEAKRKREEEDEECPEGAPSLKRAVLGSSKSNSDVLGKDSKGALEKLECPVQKENLPLESAKMYRKEVQPSKVIETTFTASSKDQTRQLQKIERKPPTRKTVCNCYGKPRTCQTCLSLKPLYAPRAGTSGFRPPEVLLKSQDQTTAVDIWACGVIFLSILSNRGNFFSNPDDVTALAEMISLFGFEPIRKLAAQCGQHLITSEKKKPLDLEKICWVLRNHKKVNRDEFSKTECPNCLQPDNYCLCQGTIINKKLKEEFPREAYDLLKKLLDVNPNTRITAKQAACHPFFNILH